MKSLKICLLAAIFMAGASRVAAQAARTGVFGVGDDGFSIAAGTGYSFLNNKIAGNGYNSVGLTLISVQ